MNARKRTARIRFIFGLGVALLLLGVILGFPNDQPSEEEKAVSTVYPEQSIRQRSVCTGTIVIEAPVGEWSERLPWATRRNLEKNDCDFDVTSDGTFDLKLGDEIFHNPSHTDWFGENLSADIYARSLESYSVTVTVIVKPPGAAKWR